jgi:glucokinase
MANDDSAPKVILAGDVGGTHARLALMEARGEQLTLLNEKIFPSHEYSNLETIVTEFLAENARKPELAGVGVAGPIRDGKCVATNLPWVVDAATVAVASGLPRVELMNDLEANAFGISTLAASDFCVLQKGAPNPKGNAAVISAGTGLGEAGMYFDGKTLQPFAGEGGHASFAPEDDLQGELLHFLAKRFGHVSCERLLSGPGLVNIYEFLRDTGRGAEKSAVVEKMRHEDPAAVISQAALADESQLCVDALELFVQIYGAEAGNLALKILATGGVYIGGGIAPKILRELQRPLFMDSFLDKGRMKSLLEAIPVLVVLNENTALIGAARGALVRKNLPLSMIRR